MRFTDSEEYKKFSAALGQVLKVSPEELKSRVESERATKAEKPGKQAKKSRDRRATR